MKYGLSEAQLQEIISFIGQYPEVEAAVLFGSRAIDTYKEASDVDIALKGARVTHGLAAKMKFDIEEDTYLPFFFDFVAYPLITNEALKTHIDTKGVVIFRRDGAGEWKVCKLGQITSKIGSGATPTGGESAYKSEGISLIRSQNVLDFGFSDGGLAFIDDAQADELRNVEVIKNDILINITGESVTRCCIAPKKYLPARVNQHVLIIRPISEQADFHFVYYYFHSIKPKLHSMAEIGGTRRALTKGMFEQLDILLPPLPEQRAIAGVLSSLDDKLDLLYRQNKTLEAMAETLFRQWFIEEADAGWEVQPLGNLITVKRGGSPRPIQDYLSNAGLRWLKISDATREGSPYIFEIKEFIKESGLNKTTLLKSGALVLSNSATPGIPKILQVDTCIHDGWLHFPESYFSKEFLYLLFKSIRAELITLGNGSIFTNLKTDILKDYKIPIPDYLQLQVFQQSIELIFEKILKNVNQIRTLEKLRDSLLPKLMSGEVRVNCLDMIDGIAG
jgi:type I restriction enzyme S subunit